MISYETLAYLINVLIWLSNKNFQMICFCIPLLFHSFKSYPGSFPFSQCWPYSDNLFRGQCKHKHAQRHNPWKQVFYEVDLRYLNIKSQYIYCAIDFRGEEGFAIWIQFSTLIFVCMRSMVNPPIFLSKNCQCLWCFLGKFINIYDE